ncbi:MAG: hypothetical protein WCL13_03520 [bacterium]
MVLRVDKPKSEVKRLLTGVVSKVTEIKETKGATLIIVSGKQNVSDVRNELEYLIGKSMVWLH